MKPVLIYLRPLDQKAGQRVDIRVADGPSADTYGVGGVSWLPAVTTRPKMSLELMSPDMDGKVQAGKADFEIALGAMFTAAQAKRLYWRGAAVVIHNTGALEGPTAVPDFYGYVTQAKVDLTTGKLSITAEASTVFLDKPLLIREFTGGGGINGDPAKRGTLYPVGYGRVKNMQPIWFDQTRNIGMIDGYGNTLDIDWLGEGLSSFGPSVGDYDSYASLAAAIDNKAIKPGQWGTCVAQGLVGLGAPPAGVITVHATFQLNRLGSIMARILAAHAGVPPARVDSAAFTALDAAVPRDVHYWTSEQRTVKDLLEAMAQSCNATPLVTFQNQVTVTRAVLGDPVATLDRSGGQDPRVIDWQSGDIDPPYLLLKARTARPASVLTDDQVLYKDVLEDVGVYNNDTIYKAGNLVWLADGSQWLYQNDRPSAGHPPPRTAAPDADGYVQDEYWFRRQPPKTAADFAYLDGTPIEALKPGTPGATRNVPRGEWNAITSYDQGDIVTYNGSTYMAKVAVPAGTLPTNTAYWSLTGAAGVAGAPGRDGTNGTSFYVWVAYADSPDGSQNFTTGSPGGRTYIGVYTGTTPTPPQGYGAYYWSKLTGDDGVDGTNGTPGQPGADGRTPYVHFAYANSQDGYTDFTTGAPGDRKYIGVYSDYTVPDSNSPADYAWSLIRGADGIPGPPGSNGSLSYIHIAYANSADGSQDFVTGQANPGRIYIGIYVDGNLSGSTYYGSYNWSRLTGANGTNGTNGTPGGPGQNGQTTYVHFAYANSQDGYTDFTTGDPGSRRYIGVYTDFTVPDSNNPAVYAWSLIKGSDGSPGSPGNPGADGLGVLTIITTGGAQWNGHNLTYTGGVDSMSNAGAYSTSTLPGGVQISFQRPNWYGSEDGFVGLSSSPRSPAGFGAVDLAWRARQESNYRAEVWIGGSLPYGEDWDGNNIYSIRYDAKSGVAYFYRNSTMVYSTNVGANRSFGFMAQCSRYTSVANVSFTAAGSAGDPGGQGPPGTSPSPKYTAFDVAGEGTWNCSYPIPLYGGQTLSVEMSFSHGFTASNGAPATISAQIQYSLDNGNAWNQMNNGYVSHQEYPNGELTDYDLLGTYTASGDQVAKVRVVVNRSGNTSAAFGYTRGYAQPQ